MKELGATAIVKAFHILQERHLTISEESYKAAFRLLFPGATPIGGEKQDKISDTKGEQQPPKPEKQLSERNIERMYWMTQHLWYRGFLKPKRRYRKPGLQLGRQKVNWEYVVDCYRREHPNDQASTNALKVTYSKAAKIINARLLFRIFHDLFIMQCSTALIRFFNHSLTLDTKDQLEKQLDELIEEWEIDLPPADNELIAFALTNWEKITGIRRALLPTEAQDDDTYGEEAKHALEWLRDYIQAHHAIPNKPLTYHSRRYSNLTYSCTPYNLLDDSPAPMYFVKDIQAIFTLG